MIRQVNRDLPKNDKKDYIIHYVLSCSLYCILLVWQKFVGHIFRGSNKMKMIKNKKLSVPFLLFVTLLVTTTVFAFTGSEFYEISVCNFAPMYGNCNGMSPSAVSSNTCGGGEDYLVAFYNRSYYPGNLKVYSNEPWWSPEKLQIDQIGGLDGFYGNNGGGNYSYYVCTTEWGSPWNICLNLFD